jgi:hypothetical protein
VDKAKEKVQNLVKKRSKKREKRKNEEGLSRCVRKSNIKSKE